MSARPRPYPLSPLSRMSVRYYLFIFIALVTLIPVAVFGIWPHSQAYDDLVADVSERNLLIAQNMARALERYDRDVKVAFQLLATTTATCSDTSAAQILLKNTEFRHICLAAPESRKVLHSVTAGEISCPAFVPEDRMRLFKSIAENGTPMFSGVLTGPDGKPIIILVSLFRDIIVIGGLRTA